ncbi:MAG: hypothetical protein SGBAC_009944 [Bacillariaceae sp.]
MFKRCLNSDDSMMVDEIYKEKDVQRLRDKLQQMKQKRQQLHALQSEVSKRQEQTQHGLDELLLQKQQSMEELESILTEKRVIHEFLELSEKWNVINDSVHIWHQGPFATIHNCRLGSEAPVILSHMEERSTEKQQQQHRKQNPTTPPRGGWNLFGSAPVANDPSSPSTSAASSNGSSNTNANLNNSNTAAVASVPKVTWPEINAALGHVVLLVQILAERSQVTLPHTLHPMGATSKIYLNGNVSSGTLYNVYFEESSLWGRSNLRNFHTALHGVCDCISQLAQSQKDKTVAVPHQMVYDKSQAHWKIGGVVLVHLNQNNANNNNNQNGQPNTTAGVDFTRACKYLLTNLKWLVAYSVKHHVQR